MPTEAPSTYLRTNVLTASPAQLRLMLLDGAIRFAEQGGQALERRDYEGAFNGVSRCQSILMELIGALRPEHDPELCQRLSSLYTFLYNRLVAALSQSDPEIIQQVLRLLRFERETWQMLLDRLASENASAGELTDTPHATPPDHAEGRPETADLVGGQVSVQG